MMVTDETKERVGDELEERSGRALHALRDALQWLDNLGARVATSPVPIPDEDGVGQLIVDAKDAAKNAEALVVKARIKLLRVGVMK